MPSLGKGALEDSIGFILAGFALTGSPGPATLSLAATGVAFGPRRGLGYLAGILTGLILVAGITASGVTGVLVAAPGVAPVLSLLAAGYIAYLAYRIATAPPLGEQGLQGRQPSYLGGIWLSLINPKGYAAMAALYSGYVLIEARPTSDIALKGAIIVLMMTISATSWLFIGGALTKSISNPRVHRALNITFAVLLVVSVGSALIL